jgi:hypothetical protein
LTARKGAGKAPVTIAVPEGAPLPCRIGLRLPSKTTDEDPLVPDHFASGHLSYDGLSYFELINNTSSPSTNLGMSFPSINWQPVELARSTAARVKWLFVMTAQASQ